jgi:hypothetical protein
VTKGDIIKFVAILFMMSLSWNHGSYSTFWSSIKYIGKRKDVAPHMSQTRFTQIVRAMSVMDRAQYSLKKGDPGFDPMWKIRPMDILFNENLRKHYKPSSVTAFDESMIPYKGKKIAYRQYMKDKPNKWGIKSYAMSCSETGILVYMEVYLGKANDFGIDALAETDRTASSTHAAVLRGVDRMLQSNLLQAGDSVVTDNYYTSIPLYMDLFKRQIFAVGTVKPSRQGYPNAATIPKKLMKGDPKGIRGHIILRTTTASDVPFLAVVFMDSKPVHMLSTRHRGDEPTVAVERHDKVKKARVMANAPGVKAFYDLTKNGVDRFDQSLRRH